MFLQKNGERKSLISLDYNRHNQNKPYISLGIFEICGELMRKYKLWVFLGVLLMGGFLWLGITSTVHSYAFAQQPTVAIPTVTSSPFGPMVTVNQDQEQINVRAGPSTTDYPIVGILEQGEKVPALGRTVGGDWIKIVYPTVEGGVAWVYAYLVTVSGGELPIVEPPPTSTPQVTPTIDPTLAAQLVINLAPTRMPTFTQPGPVEMPTYTQAPQISVAGGLPMGFIIIGLAVVGLFGLIISLFRGR
jgi:hypothetical protein